ncbi:hypothetical protein [Halapricum desulfuricans]|uniref:Uncharacterized protein n=1 Tax=Halapricum desulfuricans TaxID=2841257 RepID=A0A897N1I6_9EURY|nr:hypothetical protein [Halapricum desulfuricans]QSG06371.1 hypothetical protein HSR121_2039 [Halapricum desulfuricans]
MSQPTPRTYTYRIPIDDRKALRKINVLDSLHADYWIDKIDKRRHVPTAGNGRHFGYVFYQSKEHFDYDRNELVGGTIPGLHKYRYSLDWEPFPEDSLLEMRNANGGGTRIRGERFVGFSDPRLSDYVKIDTTVPWTPTEIKKMFDGEPVPNKVEYGHKIPEIDADTAQKLLRGLLEEAKQDGIEAAYESLHEYVENCDHDHVVTTDRKYGDVAYCEDCGHGWDAHDFEYERADLTVVGSV